MNKAATSTFGSAVVMSVSLQTQGHTHHYSTTKCRCYSFVHSLMSVSLSLYVHTHLENHMCELHRIFLNMLPVAIAWSSSGSVVIRYVHLVLWMTSRFLCSARWQLEAAAAASLTQHADTPAAYLLLSALNNNRFQD